ncbi:MAG: 4a-hydroxytetrahydrobiopterin dehydratase [bacterium JZ-2024 1]
MDLARKSCTPCQGGIPPLETHEYEPLLKQLEGWRVEDGRRLVKSYSFPNFVEAVRFVDAITPIAESEGHHPDLYVKWGEVRAILYTHKINGLHENDFILAAKLDEVYAHRT